MARMGRRGFLRTAGLGALALGLVGQHDFQAGRSEVFTGV